MGVFPWLYADDAEQKAEQVGYLKASEIYEKKINLLMDAFQERLENVYGFQIDKETLKNSLFLRVTELETQELEGSNSLSE